MIHQKDLRLGDLVQITVDLPEYKQGDTFVVIDISEVYVYIGLRSPSESDCRPDMYTIRDHIEGIHLTPEILEKNGGWKKSKASDRTLLYYKDEVYIQYDMSDMFFYFADFEYRDSIIELKYIHQLQHLLFGLGLDSEFELDMPSWRDGKYCTKINRQDK